MPARPTSGLLLGAALLLAGCPASTVDFTDPDCVGNTRPSVAGAALNTAYDPTSEAWRMCVAVQWVDPGLDADGNQGSDAPNMFPGGLFNAEFTQATVNSVWFQEGDAPAGQPTGIFVTEFTGDGWVPTDEQLEEFPVPEEGDTPDYSGCFDWDEDGNAEREDCFAGGLVDFALRMRDACSAGSEPFTGSYQLGTGRRASSEEISGCETVSIPEEE